MPGFYSPHVCHPFLFKNSQTSSSFDCAQFQFRQVIQFHGMHHHLSMIWTNEIIFRIQIKAIISLLCVLRKGWVNIALRWVTWFYETVQYLKWIASQRTLILEARFREELSREECPLQKIRTSVSYMPLANRHVAANQKLRLQAITLATLKSRQKPISVQRIGSHWQW